MDENTLIENAILAFLHNYPNHQWAVPYAELLTKVRSLKDEQSKNTTSKKRGRPAKRQRTQKTTSTKVSETTNKDA
tara:strand:- start:120 stop:347 length:228 start_codon:yes stop_codon:yes gene_type:complete